MFASLSLLALESGRVAEQIPQFLEHMVAVAQIRLVPSLVFATSVVADEYGETPSLRDMVIGATSRICEHGFKALGVELATYTEHPELVDDFFVLVRPLALQQSSPTPPDILLVSRRHTIQLSTFTVK